MGHPLSLSSPGGTSLIPPGTPKAEAPALSPGQPFVLPLLHQQISVLGTSPPKGTILCHRRGHKWGSLVTNRKRGAAGGDLPPPSPYQDFSALPTSGGGSPKSIPLQHPQGMPCLSLAGCTHPSHPDGSHHCTGSSPGTQGPRDRRVPAAG